MAWKNASGVNSYPMPPSARFAAAGSLRPVAAPAAGRDSRLDDGVEEPGLTQHLRLELGVDAAFVERREIHGRHSGKGTARLGNAGVIRHHGDVVGAIPPAQFDG